MIYHFKIEFSTTKNELFINFRANCGFRDKIQLFEKFIQHALNINEEKCEKIIVHCAATGYTTPSNTNTPINFISNKILMVSMY